MTDFCFGPQTWKWEWSILEMVSFIPLLCSLYDFYPPSIYHQKWIYWLTQAFIHFYRNISWSLKSVCPIDLKFDWHIDSSVAGILVKFQSDTVTITPNLAASRHHEIWPNDVFCFFYFSWWWSFWMKRLSLPCATDVMRLSR